MPGGFLLGGIWVYDGDPGLGIVLVLAGGVLLFAAVLLATLSLKHFDLAPFAGTRTSKPPPKQR